MSALLSAPSIERAQSVTAQALLLPVLASLKHSSKVREAGSLHYSQNLFLKITIYPKVQTGDVCGPASL